MKSKVVQIINSLMLVLSAVFIIIFFYSRQEELVIIFQKPVNSLFLILFIGINYVCILIAVMLWKVMLGYFSKSKLNFKIVEDFYIRSNINKYLPGNFGHYIARNFFVNELGITPLELNLCSILEIGFNLVTTIIILTILSLSQLMFFLNKYFIYIIVLPLLVIFVLIIVCTSSKVRRVFILHVKPLLNLKILKIFIVQFTITLIVYLIYSIILSLILVIFLDYDITYTNYTRILLSFILSWFIGFITPGAPGGIGVREAVLTFLLSPICSVQDAIMASIMLRLVNVSTDVFAYIINSIKNNKLGIKPKSL